MRKYEILYILDPQEEINKKAIESIKGQYEKIGINLIDESNMGKKRLAYEIDKKTDGYYYVTKIEIEDVSKLEEFEQEMKHNSEIIRHVKVKL